MPPSNIFPLVDKALGGKLQARLSRERRNGDSFDDIARALHADGIPVSGETVRKWCRELQIEATS